MGWFDGANTLDGKTHWVRIRRALNALMLGFVTNLWATRFGNSKSLSFVVQLLVTAYGCPRVDGHMCGVGMPHSTQVWRERERMRECGCMCVAASCHTCVSHFAR